MNGKKMMQAAVLALTVTAAGLLRAETTTSPAELPHSHAHAKKAHARGKTRSQVINSGMYNSQARKSGSQSSK